MAVEMSGIWVWDYADPAGWAGIGADDAWPADADPMSPDVARSLVLATMERAEAVRACQGYADPLLALRGAVAGCGPWEIPRLGVYDAVRESIRLMFSRFIDWEATWAAYEDAWEGYDFDDPRAGWPIVLDAHLDYTAECAEHPGLRVLGSAGSPRLQLATFCAGAYDALRRMRFIPMSGDSARGDGVDWNETGTGRTMGEAKADAAQHQTRTDLPNAAGIASVSTGYDYNGDAGYMNIWESVRVYTDPLYTVNPVDGAPFRPACRLVRESTKNWSTFNAISVDRIARNTFQCPLGWAPGPEYSDIAPPASGDPYVTLSAHVTSTPASYHDEFGIPMLDSTGFESRLRTIADYGAADTGFLFTSYNDPQETP